MRVQLCQVGFSGRSALSDDDDQMIESETRNKAYASSGHVQHQLPC